MTEAQTNRPLSDQELAEAIEQFRRNNPVLAEAMRIFALSDDQYWSSLAALYGPRISWSSSTNGTTDRSLSS